MLKKKSSVLLASLVVASLVGCGQVGTVSAPANGAGNTQAQLLSIAIIPTNPSIANNTSQDFTAIGTYSDNTTQDLTASTTWSSSDTNVATIGGLIKTVATNNPGHMRANGKGVGKTTITATSGGVSGSTTLTVTAAALVSIAVTPTNPSVAKGTAQQFTATGTFSDGTAQNLTTTVTWNSSAATVATIGNTAGSYGVATAVAAGTTTITATSGGVSGATTLTVAGGTATLSWNAPTARADGSSLNPATDLSTYKIYYGTASQTYTHVVLVPNPGTATITKTLNLLSGTYYFVVTDVDTLGRESDYSKEVSKTI